MAFSEVMDAMRDKLRMAQIGGHVKEVKPGTWRGITPEGKRIIADCNAQFTEYINTSEYRAGVLEYQAGKRF